MNIIKLYFTIYQKMILLGINCNEKLIIKVVAKRKISNIIVLDIKKEL